MRRIGITTTVVAGGLTLLIACFALGVVVGVRISRGTGEMAELMLVAWRGQNAFLQYQHADNKLAEQALLEYIDALVRIPVGQDHFFSEGSAAADITLTYVRLANVAARRGDASQARVYMSKAQENCPPAGWKDCSEQRLRDITERLDGNVGISKSGNTK